MRENSFEFIPELKLFIGTNHKPVIRDTSLGMWRRVRLVPFDAKFEGADRDAQLTEKLKAEAEGILAWAVEGARVAVDGEPGIPECVAAASEDYREAEDIIGRFLKECCWIDRNLRASSGTLFKAFEKFCGGAPMSAMAFSNALVDRGFAKAKSGGVMTFKGIGLIQNDLREDREAWGGLSVCL
jgi:putative DNA primase/helicase